MKKGILSGKYFWKFYYYDVNVKKKFSNFSIFTTDKCALYTWCTLLWALTTSSDQNHVLRSMVGYRTTEIWNYDTVTFADCLANSAVKPPSRTNKYLIRYW